MQLTQEVCLHCNDTQQCIVDQILVHADAAPTTSQNKVHLSNGAPSHGPDRNGGGGNEEGSSGRDNNGSSSSSSSNKEDRNDNGGGEGGNEDGFIRFLGLKISKDDLVTITLALAISYGIRW